MAIPLVRAMRSLLYDVQSSDPVSVVAVSLLLVAVALVATWRPARTAARVDPSSLLRG
jgi:ABC-type lipoprotein release transport system permease subunit